MVNVRARSNSEIIDAAFELYKRKFTSFFTIYLVALAPATIAEIISSSVYRADLYDPTGSSFSVLLSLISLPFLALASGVAIIIASNSYLGTGSTEIGHAIEEVKKRPWEIIKAMLMKWIFMTLGFMLLIVPAIIVFKRYFAVPATIVLENLNSYEGRRRSSELSRGNTSRILLTLGLTGLAYLIISLLFALIITEGFGASAIASVVTFVIGAALYPIIDITATVLYYDIRIRAEGYDLEIMSKELDNSAILAN